MTDQKKINLIFKKCSNLYSAIDDLNKYKFITDENSYYKATVSIDVIKDTQNAIEEYLNIDEINFKNRSTLFIYGVLQSIYCQQDGILSLYQSLIDNKYKYLSELDNYQLIETVRKIRNDIVGHPTNRNNGKAFHYLTKGNNSKTEFTYGSFKPKLLVTRVNLLEIIEQQSTYTIELLNNALILIDNKISQHKKKFRNNKMASLKDEFESTRSLFSESIFAEDKPLLDMGIDLLKKDIEKLKKETEKRYMSVLPEIDDFINIANHIISRFSKWSKYGSLYGNKDAEAFYYCLKYKLNELYGFLESIDEEFNS
ncbi:MAG: hypothetical protein KAT14_07575 [Candidatus Marinimicrobia bacterium]|nr:hypothetical protein [Candidatus Neomarinimicrobiota bacterium]